MTRRAFGHGVKLWMSHARFFSNSNFRSGRLSTEPTYKLYYFNVTGLAEPIRYLLSYCGILFQDIRLDYESQWLSKYKAEMPMGQVPVLEVDGVKFHQHLAICRYIARKNSIVGSNETEVRQMEAIVEDMNDLRLAIGRWYKEDEPSIKAVLKERALKEIPFYMGKFESLIAENDGLFVGKKVSWVDVYYAAIVEMMGNMLNDDLETDYPNLRKVSSRIRTHMMIAPYIAARPVTLI